MKNLIFNSKRVPSFDPENKFIFILKCFGICFGLIISLSLMLGVTQVILFFKIGKSISRGDFFQNQSVIFWSVYIFITAFFRFVYLKIRKSRRNNFSYVLGISHFTAIPLIFFCYVSLFLSEFGVLFKDFLSVILILQIIITLLGFIFEFIFTKLAFGRRLGLNFRETTFLWISPLVFLAITFQFLDTVLNISRLMN